MNKKSESWQYYSCGLNEKLNHLHGSRSLYTLWNSKRDGDILPAWKDFEFEDFIGLHSQIIFTEIQHEPFDLYYRIFGSFASDLYDQNLTGAKLRSTGHHHKDPDILNYYENLQKNQNIGSCTGPLNWLGKEYLHVSMIDLPLSANGENVTHFLSAIQHHG